MSCLIMCILRYSHAQGTLESHTHPGIDIDCSAVHSMAQAQQMEFSLDKDHTAWLEQEFVNGRQQGYTPTVDDFHRQLTVR